MVVAEVVKNVQVADIASATQSAQALVPEQEPPISNRPLATPDAQSRSLQRIRSAPSRGAHILQSDGSLQNSRSSSRQLLSPTLSPSMQSTDSDAVQNPLLLLPGLSHSTAASQRTDRHMHSDDMLAASKEMKSVARQITVRCLRRWDGFLGIRASSDGTGRPSGIWRDKFDGVHYAVLLLAMRKLNKALNDAAQEPSESQLIWSCHQQFPRLMHITMLWQSVQLLGDHAFMT